MSRHDPLDLIVRDASAEIREQLVEAGRRRDFAAMIARARTIDPSSVSADDAAEASTFAPVVVLRRSADPGDRDDGAAAPPRVRPQRMSRGLYGLAVAIAAVLLLSLAGAGPLARRQIAALRGEAASHHITQSPRSDRALVHDDGQTTSSGGESQSSDRLRPPEDAPAAEAFAEETFAETTHELEPPKEAAQADAEDLGAPANLDDAAQAQSAEPSPSNAKLALREGPVESLDRSARAAWRRGDLREASALFEQLIAAERAPKRVELAFGDLLIVARQLGDRRGLTRVRRDYLRRFPAGTYAEDVRAELCRDSGELRCWAAYVERWPAGAHADEARRALAERLAE